MRLRQMPLVIAACVGLAACGGAKSKGGADNRSSYEQLQAMPTDLDKSIDAVMAPINQVDTVSTTLGELPTKYKLQPDEVKELVRCSLVGEPIKLPAALDDAGKQELQKFLTDLGNFKTQLANTPNAASDLAKTVAEDLVQIPTLVGKVSAESATVQANPLASKADKDKAKAEADGAKQMQEQVTSKVQESQGKIAGLPAQATGAVAKFIDALKKVGIDNADSIMSAGQSVKTDAQKGADQAAGNTAGAATDSAKAATGSK
jgi:hypothetical protein